MQTHLSVEAEQYAGVPGSHGAAEAFGHVLTNAMPSLHRRAYQLLGNAADAEDAVQDALLAAYTHLHQFKGQARMSTWLTAIVHNSARMQMRRRLRHIHLPLDAPLPEAPELTMSERLADCRPSPEDECRSSELGERLTRFHSRLSPAQRRTLQLRDIDGLSVRETARILGVPVGTVKAQSSRARKKLKDLMQRTLRRRSQTPVSVALRRAA